MIEKQITCKILDKNDNISMLKVEGEGRYPALTIWNNIVNQGAQYYTYENGRKISVCAREKDGLKYLTTHPDGFTPNNLKELPDCE